VWNAHNAVFCWKQPALCAQAVYFLHSMIPSVTNLRLSDVSVICSVTYFRFPIQSAFLPCQSTRQHSSVCGLPNIGRCRKFGLVSLYRAYSPGNDFELIITVKMETRHPMAILVVSFGQSVSIAEL